MPKRETTAGSEIEDILSRLEAGRDALVQALNETKSDEFARSSTTTAIRSSTRSTAPWTS